MSILEEILAYKKIEIAECKKFHPVELLEKSIYFKEPAISLKKNLLKEDGTGIIAEIKRKSPSRGIINSDVSVERTSVGYLQAGASALSILTDHHFFGGSNADLTEARKFNQCPILRKDFIIEEYQIVEAKSIGADVILLIAAAMDASRLKALCSFAHNIGLEVLLEVHSQEELFDNLNADADLIGINNRNLKTFELNIEISKNLAKLIPASMVKVSESGIESPEVIMELKRYGFRGFLMGQTFMQSRLPQNAAKEFIDELRSLESKIA